ncbi:MAG: hypothetical protein UT02_C0012G0035 [Parcubacteria group bacterium GW2011_GWC2_38_7]|nr:MAG: hypothetical protein UT02_C0012G0035 [Parcubacteria group bacterium GW2011_GWC2_38_7]
MPRNRQRQLDDVLLANRTPLTDEEWTELLEIQLRQLKPYLKYMPVEPFLQFHFLRDTFKRRVVELLCIMNYQDQGRSIKKDDFFSDRYGLNVRGLFLSEKREPVAGDSSLIGTCGTCQLLGILRDGKLMLITVTFERSCFGSPTVATGYYERVTSVKAERVDFAVVAKALNRSLYEILTWLHQKIDEFYVMREQLFREAETLQREVDLFRRLHPYVGEATS